MLVAALLWYKTLKKDLEKIGFIFNPYDSCVFNRMVNGNQQTVRFHVNDLLSSHKDPKVNDEFYKWLNEKYGGYGKVKSNRGKVHDYLGMKFDFTKKGHVRIDMSEYIERTIEEFREKGYKLNGTLETPAGNDLFSVGTGEVLSGKSKDNFHTFVAKGLFASKRARPRHSTNHRSFVNESERTNRRRLEKARSTDEVPKWNLENDSNVICQRFTCGSMVC